AISGDTAIHPTQLAVSASLLTHGSSVEEIVEMLLAATRGAAGDAARTWNWQREERDIRGMRTTRLLKHPDAQPARAAARPGTAAGAPTPQAEPDPAVARAASPDTDPGAAPDTEADVESQAGPQARLQAPQAGSGPRKLKRKIGRSTVAMMIADGVIKRVRREG